MLSVRFPPVRPFSWRLLAVFVALYFLGNLAGIPLQRATSQPVEPVSLWMTATVIFAVVIAVGVMAASRTALGAPFLEGVLPTPTVLPWIRTGLALTVLGIVVAAPFSLMINLGANPDSYPFGWELLLASFKAGAVEEIGYRLLAVSLFVWVGKLVKRDADERPAPAVYWISILLAGLVFGWAHVDAGLGDPAATLVDYVLLMVVGSLVGVFFGWVFWRLGLEWAILAHFGYDAFVSLVLIPVYLLGDPAAWAGLVVVLLGSATAAWRSLTTGERACVNASL